MSKLLAMMMKEKENIEYINLTKVGNPTIVDGVLTYAYAGNNIQTPAFILDSTFELCFKFKCGANNCLCYKFRAEGIYFVLLINNTNKVSFSLTNSSGTFNITSDNSISDSTIYWVKIKRRENQIISMEISTDGENYTMQTNTLSDSTKFPESGLLIGYDGWMTGNGFSGELYLLDSYIKIGNTKYLFVLP